MKTYSASYRKLHSIFSNLENGNLTDAKKAAQRHSTFRLSMFARQVLCWDFEKASKAAGYLKGEATFQDYCDAEVSK